MGSKRSHSSQHRTLDVERERKKKKKITEDDIAKYLLNKSQKKATKVAKKLKSHTLISGYANESNPFGDPNLDEKFVWRKKIESDVITLGVPLDMFSVKAEKRKHKERMEEIEKVKKRRQEKAIEKAQHDEKMALLARERARAEFQDWENKEKEFQFHQLKAKSDIRLREGRVKPIDIFYNFLHPSDDFDFDRLGLDPFLVFQGLTTKVMEELRDDIKIQLDFDRALPTHIQFWEALLVVCDWELAKARKKEALEESGVHSSIEADVKNLLQGKTFSELQVLQSEIESQMRSGTAKVVEYWEAVLKRIQIYKAKACLVEVHAKMERDHISSSPDQKVDGTDYDGKNDQPPSPEHISYDETEEAEEAGSYSPQILHGKETEEAIDPEDDKAILERKRVAVQEAQQRRIQSRGDNFEMRAMEEGDVVLEFGDNDEVSLDSHVYWWQDKYRPRKPKYFNLVHTGYDWNKYNRSHYDQDNPPPSTVKGYKFNIFYPDLFDNAKTPTVTTEKDGDRAETCILKFHAGPPYEDLAFRILINEWDNSRKKGFKCTFERGILHLYIKFKHHCYRR